jgi:predicted dehydrogenase
LDLIQWFAGSHCTQVSSAGGLTHFKASNMPQGAPLTCREGCPATACPFDATKLYARGGRCRDFSDHIATVRGCSPDEAAEAMIQGREGRCVYRCDNDVADHQSVLMNFEGGLTATFTLTAFTVDCARKLRLQGDEGTLDLEELPNGQRLRLRRFDGVEDELFLSVQAGSHGGADALLVGAWLEAIHTGDNKGLRSGMEESLASHQIVFSAEQSRLNGNLVAIKPEALLSAR